MKEDIDKIYKNETIRGFNTPVLSSENVLAAVKGI